MRFNGVRWVRAVAAAIFAAACLLGASHSTPAAAGEVLLSRVGSNAYNVKVRSIREARFHRIVRQRFDFSCGSAAVATLLNFHYGLAADETIVFTKMFEVGDQKRIRRLGFSLLDMKNYLEQRGIRSDGFKVSLDRIAELGVPAITLIDVGGYHHFVVIKGIDDNVVLLGDPARGTRTVSRDEFLKMWNGIALIVRDRASVGRSNFNKEEDWAVIGNAPFGTAMARQSLSSYSIHLKNTLTNSF